METEAENSLKDALLVVRNLRTYYNTTVGSVRAVDNVNFLINRNRFVGIAGESGCGKTTFAQSLLRLVPYPGRIVDGQILLNGEDLLLKSEKDMERIRGEKISMVLQAAMNALDPVYRVCDLVTEALRVHYGLSKSEALEKAQNVLLQVGLSERVGKAYPHELSGGMKQRVVIAMALSMKPELVILDEPITALDVIVQRQILQLIQDLQKQHQLSFMLITHDLPIMFEVCDRISIMYAGKIVEEAPAKKLDEKQLHPYTAALAQAMPNLSGEKKRLSPIEGFLPNLINPPPGCRFHPRCMFAQDVCSKIEPELAEIAHEHYVACHFAERFL